MAVPANPDFQRRFMYLLERVGEPLYFGPRGGVDDLHIFNTPMTMCPELAHASTIRNQAFSTSNVTQIQVDRPATALDLSTIGRNCHKTALFSYFNPGHRQAVRELRDIMLRQPDTQSLFNVASACRDSEMVNPKVWVSAFISCLLNRRDTRGIRLPAVWEVLPDMFFSTFCLKEGSRQGGLPPQDRGVIVVDESFAGRNSNPENRLAYFREDLGINSHHWHWHLIYPLETTPGQRDRKGELFYYMHHAMMARYESERLANNLPLTQPLVIDEQFVMDGYFPKLTDANSSQFWGTRQNDTRLTDIRRQDDTGLPVGSRIVTLEMMKKFRDRIMEAIDTNMVLRTNGQRVPLNIDMLGDMVEASNLSPNPQFYGDVGLHNMGHIMIAYSHDPEFRHRENTGVLGDTGTAMRDPVFYRWHKYVDNLFDEHKQSLQPYAPTGGEFPLAWEGIRVTSVQVQTQRQGSRPNELSTFRMRSHADLSRGTDFLRTQNNLGPIFVRFVHLNHDPYTFTINVQNSGNTVRSGTVRIFIAPRVNEHNEQFPMFQQRRLFFELDKFTVQLQPGNNQLVRRSTESTVTIPWEQTFRDLERTVATPSAQQSICGCGWPQHMMIPRGTTAGQVYDLVVFVTNGDEDRVAQTQTTTSPQGTNSCRDAVSYCGVLDQSYPDRKPMGYPFDRNPYTVVTPNGGPQVPTPTLEDYVSRIPNMRATQIRVIFNRDRVEMRNDGVSAGMREINGDPLMSNTTALCPDSRQAPRTDSRPPGSQTQVQQRPTQTTQQRPTQTTQQRPTQTTQHRPTQTTQQRPTQTTQQRPTKTTQVRPVQQARPTSPVRMDTSPSRQTLVQSQPNSRGNGGRANQWGQRQQSQSPPKSPTGWTHVQRTSSPPGNWGGWGWQG